MPAMIADGYDFFFSWNVRGWFENIPSSQLYGLPNNSQEDPDLPLRAMRDFLCVTVAKDAIPLDYPCFKQS